MDMIYVGTLIIGIIVGVLVPRQTIGKRRERKPATYPEENALKGSRKPATYPVENALKGYRKPATYNVEIKSYKKLFQSQASLERYESGLFEAGGYKWRLVFYPKGNIADGGAEYISLYLKFDECNGPLISSVCVNYKFFFQERTENAYFRFKDAKERRFDNRKKEWGFGKFISLRTFNQPSNGFLFDDSCVFGAEVLVIEPTGKGETISVVKNPPGRIETWKIKEFSKLDRTVRSSEEYIVGDKKWGLRLYPKGTAEGKDQFLAISLALVGFISTLFPPKQVYAHFKLRLVGEDDCREKEYWKWFHCTQSSSYDDWEFIELGMLRNGFLVDDTLTIELQFLYISDVSFD